MCNRQCPQGDGAAKRKRTKPELVDEAELGPPPQPMPVSLSCAAQSECQLTAIQQQAASSCAPDGVAVMHNHMH